ncbi:MAG TPA: 50S ribosomal protein L4 [Patescibacteria group bacterium]|nr:50S ribosomal protein L4 [Patescibacteria group bacterium]
MKIEITKISAKKNVSSTLDVSDNLLSIKSNPKLISQATQRQLANRRRPLAHTKDRGEVSGGGRKPFRQKGTGNARAGSNRSPLWIGGGRVFGPRKNRNFSKRMPQKMIQKAILAVISDKFRNKRLIVVDKFPFSQIKTKDVEIFLEKLPIEEGKILILLATTDVNLELAAANLPYLKVILLQNINLLDLLKYDYLLTDREGLKGLENIFLEKEVKK